MIRNPNQTVNFKSFTEVKDDGGSIVDSAETSVLANHPCVVDTANSSQILQAEKRGFRLEYVIYCNYNALINEDLRVTWDSNDYDIGLFLNPNNLNRELHIGIYRHG